MAEFCVSSSTGGAGLKKASTSCERTSASTHAADDDGYGGYDSSADVVVETQGRT